MDYNKVFSEIPHELRNLDNSGQVASYIPELGGIDPDKFGIHLTTLDDQQFSFGDSSEPFSIQSIAKVLSLTYAIQLDEEKLWERVGVEPSGTSFNSLVQLEYEKGIPRNPLINAGAMVICDILVSRLKNPKAEFIKFVREISDCPDIDYSPKIADSEQRHGYRNRALVNFIKSYGNIKNEVDTVLDFYFNLCSIEMSCEHLAQTFLFLANKGTDPATGVKVLDEDKTRRMNAIMQLCGFYDEAGEFAFKVGLPGKSGVGGGIIAIHPGKYSIAVWSPRLNKKGNSYRGMRILEFFTSHTKSSIF